MANNVKIALYQEWPARKHRKYGVDSYTEPTKIISLHPATKEGLDEAVANAERSDAVLVKITKEYFDADKLMGLIQDKIRAKKCVRVFKPANRLPRS